MRYGWAGWRKPAGLLTNDPRATKWSSDSMVAPLATGAFGMRNAVASSRTSAPVRSATQEYSSSAFSLACSVIDSGDSSSIQSS